MTMPTVYATETKPKQTVESSPAHVSKISGSGSAPVGLPLFLQPKLAISQPNDPAEQEADRVAEQVMRMPDPVLGGGRPESVGNYSVLPPDTIQRQEAKPTDEERTEAPRFLTHEFDLRLDWFEMTRPFYTRGAESLLYFDDRMYQSIGNVWAGNYTFFFDFGLSDKLSADAANFFTPFGLDSALKHDYATASEIFERQADISSLVISPTVFQFDLHDIPGTLRMPFLKIFGVEQSNPYAKRAKK
jgi:hypothetical protein